MSSHSILFTLLLAGCELDGTGQGEIQVGIGGGDGATARMVASDGSELSLDADLFLNVEAIRVRHVPTEPDAPPCPEEDGYWDEDEHEDYDDDNGEWETIYEGFATVNLSDPMSSHEAPIAIASLPPGDIYELRLVLASDQQATLVYPDGQEQAVTVPSGSSSGLKLKGCMPVRDDSATVIDVTLGVDEALHTTGAGELKLQPSLKVSWSLVPEE